MRKTVAALVLGAAVLAPSAMQGLPQPSRRPWASLPLSEGARKDDASSKIRWGGETLSFDAPVIHFIFLEKSNELRVLTEADFVARAPGGKAETSVPHSPKDREAGIACGLVLRDGNPVFVNKRGEIVFLDYPGGMRTRERLKADKMPACELAEPGGQAKKAADGKGRKTRAETHAFRTEGKGAHEVVVTVAYPERKAEK